MIIEDYISEKALQKYIQIIGQIKKPINFILCSADKIKAFGLCKKLDDKYYIYLASELIEQEDIDHNFLHECLHVLQYEHKLPVIYPKEKYMNNEKIINLCDEISSAFMDIWVEKKLKKWGFKNYYIKKARFENLNKIVNSYSGNGSNYLRNRLIIYYILTTKTYDKSEIIKTRTVLKKCPKIINISEKILKELKGMRDDDYKRFKEYMEKTIFIIGLNDKIRVKI